MNVPPDYLRPINDLSLFTANFIGRIPGVPTSFDKNETLAHAQTAHDEAAHELGFKNEQVYLAEQIHAKEIAVITSDSASMSSGADGLICQESGILLGIHVADCGALYLADPITGAFGLLHSGKKGTELNITGQAVAAMSQNFGSDPADLVAVLAPCIRPPHYEVDFAQTIRQQAIAAGIKPENYHDCGLCTASNLSDYYSYRLEKGNTGRMLALLGRSPRHENAY